MTSLALEICGITKAFGNNVAVDGVGFSLQQGEIHALLGENGAGKSTLMNLIYGLYQPDSGEIRIDGKPVVMDSPNTAIARGIGMVHQHFMLVPSLSVAENIALSSGRGKFRFRRKDAEQHVFELSARYGLSIPPRAKVWQLSVGLQQRVEILKALSAAARILILDEPTAALSSPEIAELFDILRRLRDDGHSIIFISHKLKEVMALSDRITVLRRGRNVVTTRVDETSPADLARQMVGHELPLIERPPQVAGDVRLEICSLTVVGHHDQVAVDGCSFDARAGEIVGIAGVDGNGQIELVEAIVGLRKAERGSIRFNKAEITNLPPSKSRQLGYGYIPEDRQTAGLILNFTIAENLILNVHRLKRYQKGFQLDRKRIDADADALIRDYDVRTTNRGALAKSLSGGNQQKVVIARELSQAPELLLAVNPTRGLDIGATDYVHQRLLEQRRHGHAVLLISTELDEVLGLSDRIFVMYQGKLTEATPFREDLSKIGLLMAGGESVNR
ncbi:MAG: ABC transporter ATP-binding protein [Candidatus Poribacteria bacterium]|nr:ABC transporter ATP-binding protein [Candidatus Poribacteria bacterium]